MLKLLLSAVMVASLVAAVRAPAPAARMAGRVVVGLLAIPVAFHTTALLALLGGRPGLATVALVAAIEASCYLTWLTRDEGRDDGDGGWNDGPVEPWDWDAFDRERAGWARRPRVRA